MMKEERVGGKHGGMETGREKNKEPKGYIKI
jgi:hypothetical protein